MNPLTPEQINRGKNFSEIERKRFDAYVLSGRDPVTAFNMVVNAPAIDTTKKPTAVGQVIRDVLETPARMVQNIQAVGRIAGGQSFDEATAPRESEFFGKGIAPIGTANGGGLSMENLRESVGAGVELASYLPVGRGFQAGVRGIRGLNAVGQTAKTVAREGAISGGLFEIGDQMGEGEFDPLAIAQSIILGGAGGFALGGLGSLAGQGASRVTKTLRDRIGSVARKSSDVVTGVVDPVIKNIRNRFDNVVDEATIRRTLSDKPNAVKVFNETGSTGFIDSIDNSISQADLNAKKRILQIAQERIGDASKAQPRIVIAEDYVAPRLELLGGRLKEVGETIGLTATDSSWRKTDDLVNFIIEEARKNDVIITPNRNGTLSVSPRQGIAGVDQAKIKVFEDIVQGFRQGSQRRASQLHSSRKNLTALTKRTDTAKELVSPGGAVDNIRRKISETIGDDYLSATQEYSKLAQAIGELEPDFAVRLSDESFEELANIKYSELARRLLSNASANTRANFQAIDDLYRAEMSRLGRNIEEQNLLDLVDFAGAIEEGFGIVPRNSFFGQTAGGTGEALQGISLGSFLSKPKVNNKRAIQAMIDYINTK